MSWFVYKLCLPLGVPVLVYFLAVWLKPSAQRITDVFRDGTLMMFCAFSACDLLLDLSGTMNGTTQFRGYGTSAAFGIVVFSMVIYTFNIIVDETGSASRRLRECLAAGLMLGITLLLVIYFRWSLELWA